MGLLHGSAVLEGMSSVLTEVAGLVGMILVLLEEVLWLLGVKLGALNSVDNVSFSVVDAVQVEVHNGFLETGQGLLAGRSHGPETSNWVVFR